MTVAVTATAAGACVAGVLCAGAARPLHDARPTAFATVGTTGGGGHGVEAWIDPWLRAAALMYVLRQLVRACFSLRFPMMCLTSDRVCGAQPSGDGDPSRNMLWRGGRGGWNATARAQRRRSPSLDWKHDKFAEVAGSDSGGEVPAWSLRRVRDKTPPKDYDDWGLKAGGVYVPKKAP